MHHFRWRRAAMAAVASLCASAAIAPAAMAAPNDLPDLVQSIPAAPDVQLQPGETQPNWGGFFDDHSISGDNHLGWSYGDSDHEALMVRFQSVLTNNGNGALEMCGYPSANGNWMRAFQMTDDVLNNCPTDAPAAGAAGWFRYAIANHSGTGEFNRWHLMDLQRFALVPLSAPAGTRTQWDTRWGTCLNTDQYMDCEHAAAPARLNSGIPAHTTKVTEEGAPDQTVVAFPSRLPNGTYQLVAISNPYGAIREAGTQYGSVACVNLRVEGDPDLGEWKVYETADQPADCRLPTAIPGALTGPGGPDPFQGAVAQTPCNPLLTATGHCWATIPETAEPGGHPAARTNVRDSSTATATRSVAQYGAVGTYSNDGGGDDDGGDVTNPPVVNPPAVNPPRVNPPGVNPPKINPPITLPKVPEQRLTLPTLQARKARSYTRSALRKTFHVLPSSAKVSCKLTGGASATCKASWRRKGGRSYRGTLHIWFTSTTKHVRWRYDVNVKRTQRHHRTATIKRAARTGGTLS